MTGRYAILDRTTGELIELPDFSHRRQLAAALVELKQRKGKRPLTLTVPPMELPAADLAAALFGEVGGNYASANFNLQQ